MALPSVVNLTLRGVVGQFEMMSVWQVRLTAETQCQPRGGAEA